MIGWTIKGVIVSKEFEPKQTDTISIVFLSLLSQWYLQNSLNLSNHNASQWTILAAATCLQWVECLLFLFKCCLFILVQFFFDTHTRFNSNIYTFIVYHFDETGKENYWTKKKKISLWFIVLEVLILLFITDLFYWFINLITFSL